MRKFITFISLLAMLSGGALLNAQVKVIVLSVDQTGIEQCINTVIEKPLDEQLTLFPNPNDGNFTLKMAPSVAAELTSMEVIDNTGRIIHKKDATDRTSVLDIDICLGDIEAGIYFLKVHAKEQVHTRKFVIQNRKR